MRIFLIGGTGFLGSRVRRRLQAEGHELTLLTRSAERLPRLRAEGFQAIFGDALDPDSYRQALGPQDLILLMAMPAVQPDTRISRRQFLRLRQETTTLFAGTLALARSIDRPVIATAGASFRTRGQEIADETWPIDRRGLAGLGGGMDPLMTAALRTGSPPLTVLLPGQIYGNGGLFRNMMYAWMKQGRFRVIGSGENRIPRIHVDDCAGAYVKAVTRLPLGQKLIIADDTPCTVREFSNEMADAMGLPHPGHVPGLLVRLAKGNLTYQTATMDCMVSNARAKQVLGWQPAYPSYREGLPAVIAEIEREQQPESEGAVRC